MVLYFTTLGTGSLVLGLAYISQEFSADDILAAAFVEELLKDEIYMASFYGSAPEQEKKYRSLKSDLIALAPFLKD